MYHGIYADLTLEFLNSLYIRKHSQYDYVMYFRIANVDRKLTIREFAKIFGMPVRGREETRLVRPPLARFNWC